MRSWLGLITTGLLLALTLAVAGCTAQAGGSGSGQGAVTVSKATASGGKLSGGSVVSGKLVALSSANVVPKMAGRVAAIPVDVGSEVKEGDLLVRLDAAELAALVDLYAAQLDKARNSDLPAQKNQAELNLANAGAAFKTSEADYERSKQLRDAAVISPQQFEQVERQYLQAKAAFEAAQKGLDILENATIPQTIRQFEAQLNKARADFANSVIRSPISGVVTARNVNPGEMASPAQPVVSLANLDTVLVEAGVGEEQVNNLKAGQVVRVKVGAVRDEPFAGKVTNIALAASPSTKVYPVKIQIENPGHLLKPGMFAEVFLDGGDEEGVVIPRDALVRSDGKEYVWVVTGGRASKREVVAGPEDGKSVVVKSGLRDGEEVAVTGLDSLSDGMTVGVQD